MGARRAHRGAGRDPRPAGRPGRSQGHQLGGARDGDRLRCPGQGFDRGVGAAEGARLPDLARLRPPIPADGPRAGGGHRQSGPAMTAEVLARKIAKVMDKLQRIAEVGAGSLDQVREDRSRRDLLAFYLALAVEDCIDIAEHLIAERGWGAPDSYGEAFRLLAQHGVLSSTLAELMVQAAGMRNAILHE